MRHILLIALGIYLLPVSVLAARSTSVAPASFRAGESLVAASSSPGNSYAVGASVVLTAPVTGDFSALGGSVVTASQVSGDDLIFGGSISSRAPVAGDLRAVGGSIDIGESVGGDLVALGFSVNVGSRAKGSVFIVAMNTTLANGASGPVTIYGNNIALAGEFAGDVKIIAGGHVSLATNTLINGKLSYEAPDIATIPASAKIVGGISYTNASYLPDIGTSRILAFVSIGFFLVARIVGALILASLLAGLFPAFAELVIDKVSRSRMRGRFLASLLGFGIIVATPIVISLLLLTFVGIGLALLLLIAYALIMLLSVMYAGVITGGLLSRHFIKRKQILWHDGVLGMLVLSLIALIPFIGLPIVFITMCVTAGVLLQIFFRFAFPQEERIT